MQGFDKNSLIGMLLMFGIIFAWQTYMQPSQADLDKQKRTQDSIRLADVRRDSLVKWQEIKVKEANTQMQTNPQGADSLLKKQFVGRFGAFSGAAFGNEQLTTLENNLMKVTFSNKGGIVKSVEMKNHTKVVMDANKNESKVPLLLLNDVKNKFEYVLPVNGVSGGVRTSDLFFVTEKSGNTVTFKADAGNGRFFEQKYTLSDNNYDMAYDLKFEGLNQLVPAGKVQLVWENYLDKLEKSVDYERNYSTTYFKETDDNPSYCTCTANDTKNVGKPIKWITNTNQFFNSSLISTNNAFASANLSTEMLDNSSDDLKKLYSDIQIPYGGNGSETFSMKFYNGPNEYDRLKAYNVDLQDIVPYGSSIFGTINRWVILPVFNFLSKFIGSKGIVILLLTLLVKLALFPLTYKMLQSSAKMQALKPEIDALRKRLGDDQQKISMETMKLYGEYGVSPLGGCMPMLLQMPIWIALFRFFPANIDFRQKGFLWANDLTAYDSILNLPFSIPLWGSHVSLFTILWMISTLVYTYYNMQQMDMTAGGNANAKMMKWMQYLMPIFFGFTFNNYASGLSCYMFFSNILNIAQTVGGKSLLFDTNKLKAELDENKKKPKKVSAFRSKLEDAMKEQQRMQEEAKKKKK